MNFLRHRFLTFTAACASLAAAARAIEVPAGFAFETIATELNAATALALAPDGRIFIADQTGPLRIWKDGALLPTPALDLSERLDTWWERGLIGITLAPDFPRTPHVFILYVAKSPHTHHVLGRFTLTGDMIDPASERILLEGDDQTILGGSQPGGHQGGPLRFGPDGKLYVSLGEQTARKLAQSLEHLQGKILRLNADGSIPVDNPFYAENTGKYRAIWALGLRNPFGLAFQPETKRLFATDVGQTSWEEVNEILPGANYGWPSAEGPSSDPAFRNPLHAYSPAFGRSIVGGVFYPRTPPSGAGAAKGFPARWRGQFFFADWAANWIKALDPDKPEKATNFARGFNGPVALEIAPDGSMLVLDRGTIWRDGSKFKSNSGALTRIRYTGETAPAADEPPELLSLTGLFADLATRTPAKGFEPFELNAPPWLPGVCARRWLHLPGNVEITLLPDGEVRLGEGAIVVQHFETSDARPFETHVYWFTATLPRAAAYRWRNDGLDATLIREAEIVSLPGQLGRQWHSPAPEPALNLATSISGFVLHLTVGQLNRDAPRNNSLQTPDAISNQLLQWSRRGWIVPALRSQDVVRLPRLAALDDTAAPVELRVRSYLEANCAICHRPGGSSRALFDARVATPLRDAHLLNALPIAGDLGIPDARIIVPGSPERSLLLRRMQDNGAFRMPPVRLHDEPSPALPLIEAWIRSLQ